MINVFCHIAPLHIILNNRYSKLQYSQFYKIQNRFKRVYLDQDKSFSEKREWEKSNWTVSFRESECTIPVYTESLFSSSGCTCRTPVEQNNDVRTLNTLNEIVLKLSTQSHYVVPLSTHKITSTTVYLLT